MFILDLEAPTIVLQWVLVVLGFIEAFLNLNLLPNLDRRDPEKAQNLSFKKVQGNTGNRLVHLGYAGMEIVRIRVLDRRIEVGSPEVFLEDLGNLDLAMIPLSINLIHLEVMDQIPLPVENPAAREFQKS